MMVLKQLLPLVPYVTELISVDNHQLHEGIKYEKCPQRLHYVVPVTRQYLWMVKECVCCVVCAIIHAHYAHYAHTHTYPFPLLRERERGSTLTHTRTHYVHAHTPHECTMTHTELHSPHNILGIIGRTTYRPF